MTLNILSVIIIGMIAVSSASAYETGKGAPWNLSAAVKDAVTDASTNQEFVSYEYKGIFACDIPKQWRIDDGTMQFGLSPEKKKIFGIHAFAPEFSERPVRISVHFYADGNMLHKDMNEFIQSHAKPILGYVPEGSSYGPVKSAIIAGRKAKKFEQKKSEFVADRSIREPGENDPRVYEKMAKKIYVVEQFIVIPAQKGFYALSFYAPAETAHLFQQAFDKVAGSFKPLK